MGLEGRAEEVARKRKEAGKRSGGGEKGAATEGRDGRGKVRKEERRGEEVMEGEGAVVPVMKEARNEWDRFYAVVIEEEM